MARSSRPDGASALLLVTLLACLVHGHAAAGQSGLSLDGQSVNPLNAAPRKIVVLVFIRRDCPVSGRYAPTIERISKEFGDDVRFWLVYPDKDETPEAIGKNLDDYRYHLPALRDPNHALVKLARVKVTPEAAVFDRNHRLVYGGRIDNWYQDLTRVRPTPTTHELEDAIRAALGGKSIANTNVRGVGCYIADLD